MAYIEDDSVCADNGCFWRAMMQLGDGMHKTRDLFEHPFDGFSWIGHGHHPIAWTSHVEGQHDARCEQLFSCMEAACPGLVELILPSRAGIPVHEVEARMTDFFQMSQAIVGVFSPPREAYHVYVPDFYSQVTPAAVEPYEHVFHRRMRSTTYKDAVPIADMFLLYKDGELEDNGDETVRHLSLDVGRDDLSLYVNRERALYYKERYFAEWHQKAGEKHRLKAPVSDWFPWQRCDTLLNLAMRAVVQRWPDLSERQRTRVNQMFQSWSTSEPVQKRARKK